jgi:hypothetical protein
MLAWFRRVERKLDAVLAALNLESKIMATLADVITALNENTPAAL